MEFFQRNVSTFKDFNMMSDHPQAKQAKVPAVAMYRQEMDLNSVMITIQTVSADM